MLGAVPWVRWGFGLCGAEPIPWLPGYYVMASLSRMEGSRCPLLTAVRASLQNNYHQWCNGQYIILFFHVISDKMPLGVRVTILFSKGRSLLSRHFSGQQLVY